ncbi:MAG: DNA translocase FtsK [Bacteroidales bacterium]|nr:DNA translocase FtsK [Bacteroidales bacterium]
MTAKKKRTKSLIDRIREINFTEILKNDKAYFITGLTLVVLMLYLSVAIISFFFTGAADQSIVGSLSLGQLKGAAPTGNWAGTFGAWLSNIIMNKWFGVSSLLLAFYGLLASFRLMRVKTVSLGKWFVYCLFMFFWLSVFFGFFFSGQQQLVFLGGAYGWHISQWLRLQAGSVGTILILVVTLVIFLIFVFQNTIPFIRRILQLSFLDDLKEKRAARREEKQWRKEQEREAAEREAAEREAEEREAADRESEPAAETEPETLEPQPAVKTEPITITGEEGIETTIEVAKAEDTPADSDEEPVNVSTTADDHYDALKELGPYDPTADLHSFRNPPARLLKEGNDDAPTINRREHEENQHKILDVLQSFGIRVQSIHATVGPTVTLYEIVPEAGIRISKIKSLENDIALSLSALGIRIIAPIPGKGTIGIEVPSRNPSVVYMRGLIQSKKFQESKYDLPIVLGKTIMNEVFAFDLCKMPHLLVAGATGQGKSVGLNAIITSLLYKKHPAELKIVLVDPKMVEFSIYKDIENYYLAKIPGDGKAIITDSDKVIQTLQSLTVEMDDRYRLLSMATCRNIKEYNEKFKQRKLNPEKGHHFMPYIVIIIDEFGDLIMTAGKEIELPIARIAQKARAVGMHMIIATQRPTTNIITGTIKANFPARLAFRVASQIDSRTILDASGAQQLIGKGDALFSQGSDLTRIQCTFVDTPEVEEVVHFIADQRGYPHAFELPEYVPEGGGGAIGDLDGGARDSLFEEAARLVVLQQQGSTSYIQRKFSIGFNRAGRIMDQLQGAGIVGPAEGSKPRQVLIDSEMQLDMLLSSLK